MSLEIELRGEDCAQRGCGGTMKTIRSPARNKPQARAQRVRCGILLWPVYPVSQQIGRISISLLRDENTMRIQRFAPKNNSNAIQHESNGFCILQLARLHEKTGPDFVRPGAKVLQFAVKLEDELQRVLNLPVAALACELRLSKVDRRIQY